MACFKYIGIAISRCANMIINIFAGIGIAMMLRNSGILIITKIILANTYVILITNMAETVAPKLPSIIKAFLLAKFNKPGQHKINMIWLTYLLISAIAAVPAMYTAILAMT